MLHCMSSWGLYLELFEWVFAVETELPSKYFRFLFSEHVCFKYDVNLFLNTYTSQQMLTTEIGVFPNLTHVAPFFLHYC